MPSHVPIGLTVMFAVIFVLSVVIPVWLDERARKKGNIDGSYFWLTASMCAPVVVIFLWVVFSL